MTDIMLHDRLRSALGSVIGRPLTPEVAAFIEVYVFGKDFRGHDPRKFEVETYKNIEFRCEKFEDIIEELKLCHQEHYAETEHYRLGLSLAPKYAEIAEFERLGQAIQFTARNQQNGELAGNILMYIERSLHNDCLVAHEDTLFIKPSYRKGFMAVRFMQYVENCLKQIGVREIHTDSKTVNNAHRLVEYLGYKHVANRYAKVFGD